MTSKIKAGALALTMLSGLTAYAADYPCAGLFESVRWVDALSRKELLKDRRVVELALLHRAVLDAKTDAERFILLQDFKLKFRQLENAVGPGLRDVIELAAARADLSAEKARELEKSEEKKKQARRRKEKGAITILEEVLDLKLKSLHQLDGTYFHDRKGSGSDIGAKPEIGSGIYWGENERYIAVRDANEDYSKRVTRIYDMKTRKRLKFSPRTGTLARSGPIYYEDDGINVTVHDLETGEKWDPIPGNAAYLDEHANRDFVTTRTPKPSKRFKSLEDDHFTIHDFRRGRKLDMGIVFAVSSDFTRVAYEEKPGKIAVFDLITWTRVRGFKGTPTDYGQKHDFLEFEREGKQYVYRLRDDRVFEVPVNALFKYSADGKFIFFKTSKEIDVKVSKKKTQKKRIDVGCVFELETGKLHEFPGLGEGRFSEDGSVAMIYKAVVVSDGVTMVLDLATGAERKLDGAYDTISPNGRFVYGSKTGLGSGYEWGMYDLKADAKIGFKAGFDLNFIGKTDFFLAERSEGKKTVIYVQNAAQACASGMSFVMPVGETEAKPSSSGDYVVIYENGSVHIKGFNP